MKTLQIKIIPDSPILLSRQLHEIWENSSVAPEYRQIVQDYLQSLSATQKQKYLNLEIQESIKQKSHYFLIFRICMRRKIAVFKIRNTLKILKFSFQLKKWKQISILVSNLRELNIQISQYILKLVDFFNIILQKTNNKVLLYLWNLIQNIHQQNCSVISGLKFYVDFLKFCDPYLMYPYKKQSNPIINEKEMTLMQDLLIIQTNQFDKIFNLRTEIISLRTQLEQRLNEKGYNYIQDIRSQREESIFGQDQSFQKLRKPWGKKQPQRAQSHNTIIRKETDRQKEIKRNIFKRHQITSSKLIKIKDKNSKTIYFDRASQSLDLGYHLTRNKKKINLEHRSQSLRSHQLKLKIVRFEPISLHPKENESYGTIKKDYQRIKLRGISQGNLQIMRKPESQTNNLKRHKYEQDSNKISNNFAGFIKNIKFKQTNRSQEVKQAQKFLTKSRKSNLGTSNQLKKQTGDAQQIKENESQIIDRFCIIVKKEPQINYAVKEVQTEELKNLIANQQMQTQFSQYQLEVNPVKNDRDCQTQKKNFFIPQVSQAQFSTEDKQSLNRQQYSYNVCLNQINEKDDDESSLVTLEEQYFIDERRLTAIKKLKAQRQEI